MDVLDQLKQAPDALLILKKFEHFLQEEAEKKAAFLARVHENQKAEFINGGIFLHSPVRMAHLRVSSRLSHQLMNHIEKCDLGFVGIEKMMIALTRNYYEPDIVFFRKEVAERFQDAQKLFPAPDLVVEILSESTRQNDYGIKFQDYAAHGVGEYWIVDAEAAQLEQYALLNESFVLQARLGPQDTLQALVIPQFVLPLAGIFG
ncbi:MAG: Uma2 family endonuclease [Microscillaceae bacterium]